MKKYLKSGFIISLCLLVLCGCGKIPKLKNGEEAVITFKKDDTSHQISAEELYEELKTNFGLEATINLIDNYVLESEFADYIDEAKENAASYINAMVKAYGDEKTLLQAIQQNTNYSTIEAYQEYLYLNFMDNHALEEYAKSLITDKEINAYYKDEVKGDIEVYHILVTPKVKDDMTDEEKTAAEDAAKTKIQDIIQKLKEADNKLDTFKKLVKEFSEDESTKDKDGNLGYINYGDLSSEYDELIEEAYKLKDGEFSTKVITTELGYHVIYRNNTKDKEPLEDIKDNIIETLANKKISEDTNLALESKKYYRKLYNVEIIDSTLNKQYGIYLNNLANSSN